MSNDTHSLSEEDTFTIECNDIILREFICVY